MLTVLIWRHTVTLAGRPAWLSHKVVGAEVSVVVRNSNVSELKSSVRRIERSFGQLSGNQSQAVRPGFQTIGQSLICARLASADCPHSLRRLNRDRRARVMTAGLQVGANGVCVFAHGDDVVVPGE